MIVQICHKCGREYWCKKYMVGSSKYCSSSCYHEASRNRAPWNKGMHAWLDRVLTGKTIICGWCGSKKYFEPNQLKKRPCKYCSVKCARLGEQKVILSYTGLHSWIRRMRGKRADDMPVYEFTRLE